MVKLTKTQALLFSSLLLFTTVSVSAQKTDSAATAKKLIGIEQALVDAIPKGDTKPYEKYIANDCYFITEDGSSQSKKGLINSLHPFPPGFSGYIRIVQPHLTFRDPVIVLNYVADEHETVYGQQLHTTYGIANTYHHGKSGWEIIASQTFEIPQLPPAVKIPANILQVYTGVYQITPGIQYKISLSNDTLYGQKTGRQKEILIAETSEVFFTNTDTRSRKIFSRDEQGRLCIRARRNGEDLIWKKVE